MPSKSEFLKSSAIAIYGVSPKRKTFAAGVNEMLGQKGFKTYLIHPDAPDDCYADLDRLPEKVDAVYVAVSKKNALSIINDVADYGARKIWLQNGAFNNELIEKCKNAGLETYTGCLMMFIPDAGFGHSLHRFLYELFKGKQ